MGKIRLTLIALLSLLIFGMFFTAVASDSTILSSDVMKTVLRAQTTEQNAYIDYVMAKVDKGELPASLVDSTFQWASKKNTKYRFQYFKHALILRAQNLGITI